MGHHLANLGITSAQQLALAVLWAVVGLVVRFMVDPRLLLPAVALTWLWVRTCVRPVTTHRKAGV